MASPSLWPGFFSIVSLVMRKDCAARCSEELKSKAIVDITTRANLRVMYMSFRLETVFASLYSIAQREVLGGRERRWSLFSPNNSCGHSTKPRHGYCR